MAGDVEHVLDREGQAAQRAFGRAGKLDVGQQNVVHVALDILQPSGYERRASRRPM
jgi:hypothetical protein